MSLTVEIATVPDRAYRVAEIWDGDWMIAEINNEKGAALTLEVYAPKEGDHLSVPLDDFIAAIATARDRLAR